MPLTRAPHARAPTVTLAFVAFYAPSRIFRRKILLSMEEVAGITQEKAAVSWEKISHSAHQALILAKLYCTVTTNTYLFGNRYDEYKIYICASLRKNRPAAACGAGIPAGAAGRVAGNGGGR